MQQGLSEFVSTQETTKSTVFILARVRLKGNMTVVKKIPSTVQKRMEQPFTAFCKNELKTSDEATRVRVVRKKQNRAPHTVWHG